MGQPDVATLRLVLGFAGVLSLAVMAVLRHAGGRGDGTGQWLAAAVLSVTAYLLPPAVRWSRPDLCIAVNSGLTLSSMLLMLEGALVLRGFGDAGRRRVPVTMACLGILALMLVSAGRPWLHVVLHDALACLLLVGTGMVLAWRAPRWSWAAAGGMGLLFAGLGLLYLWRGGGLLLAGPGADTRMPAWLLAATLVWAMGWTGLFPALAVARERERRREVAERDALTGLASRGAFLRQAVLVPGRQEGLLLLGLEGVRALNGSLGHEEGDRLLAAFAARLREAAGPDMLAGRLTGAQFALLLPGMKDRADLLATAGRLRAALSVPLVMGDRVQVAEFSLGTALAPEDGRSVTGLLEAAERAMFRVRAVAQAVG
ncbi:diguanylate cyclase domain-containing protein [Niveispirillum sp. KHB5.9]|uniref:GGDEF domain-containing protein n=1 Tax=Niveispirillum sp. KHB5.9 TaxID=3400269 RepID=UPI003A8487C7